MEEQRSSVLRYELTRGGPVLLLYIEHQCPAFSKWVTTENFVHDGIKIQSVDSPQIRQGFLYLKGSFMNKNSTTYTFCSAEEARLYEESARKALEACITAYINSTTPSAPLSLIEQVDKLPPEDALLCARKVLDRLPASDRESLFNDYGAVPTTTIPPKPLFKNVQLYKDFAPIFAQLFADEPNFTGEILLSDNDQLYFRFGLLNGHPYSLRKRLGITHFAEKGHSVDTVSLFRCK